MEIILQSPPKTWVDILIALSTPIVGCIAAYIAYQQHRTNKNQLKYQLYERRLEVYRDLVEFLDFTLGNGKTEYNEISKLYSKTSVSIFLFDDDTQKFFEELRKRLIRYCGVSKKLSLTGPGSVPVGEVRCDLAGEEREMFLRLMEQRGKLKDIFKKYFEIL